MKQFPKQKQKPVAHVVTVIEWVCPVFGSMFPVITTLETNPRGTGQAVQHLRGQGSLIQLRQLVHLDLFDPSRLFPHVCTTCWEPKLENVIFSWRVKIIIEDPLMKFSLRQTAVCGLLDVTAFYCACSCPAWSEEAFYLTNLNVSFHSLPLFGLLIKATSNSSVTSTQW